MSATPSEVSRTKAWVMAARPHTLPAGTAPVIVGVGAGGTYCTATALARRALLRPLGSRNGDDNVAEMESEILQRVNDLGIGPQGLGGRTTALGALMETAPCHIASMPVAVNLGCHAHRHGEVRIEPGD